MSGIDVAASQSGGPSPKVRVASGATAGQYEFRAAHNLESSGNGLPSPNDAKKSAASFPLNEMSQPGSKMPEAASGRNAVDGSR